MYQCSICGTCTEDPLSLAGFLAKMACGLLTVPIYRHFRSPASLPAQMACGLLVVPIPRHYNRSTFARRLPCSHGLRLAHGTHPPTLQPIHFRSPAYLLKFDYSRCPPRQFRLRWASTQDRMGGSTIRANIDTAEHHLRPQNSGNTCWGGGGGESCWGRSAKGEGHGGGSGEGEVGGVGSIILALDTSRNQSEHPIHSRGHGASEGIAEV